jgi:hypothetical protein
MSHLKNLWVGMTTRNTTDAGTDSSIFLTVTSNNIEQLHHTFPDTLQDDQERGQANLYSINVATNDIFSERLTTNSISVGIDGKDQWSPQHIVVWGNSDGGAVIPLGIATNITDRLSKAQNEGRRTLPIPPVNPGSDTLQINRLLMLMLTADAPDSGTEHAISIQISSGGRLVVDSEITDTPQKDQDTSQANLYFVPVKSSFTRRSLNASSITLRILGDDVWTPSQFFLFGLDDAAGRPESLVPLVHIPSWQPGLPSLSTDISEGKPSVKLPLV